MPPSSKLLQRCAVRSWMSAAAAIAVAFSFNCHKPITNNQSRGHNLLSSKIELVQSVNMANCWPKRTAQCSQLKRCRPLAHRSRDSTASLLQRGHWTPLGQRNCRTLIGSRALSQLHSDSMGTCTGVRPSNSLAVHCLDHGRLLAVDDPLTSSYATNALLPMSVCRMLALAWARKQLKIRRLFAQNP